MESESSVQIWDGPGEPYAFLAEWVEELCAQSVLFVWGGHGGGHSNPKPGFDIVAGRESWKGSVEALVLEREKR